MRKDEIDNFLMAPPDCALDGVERAIWSRLEVRLATRHARLTKAGGAAVLMMAVVGGIGIGVALAPSRPPAFHAQLADGGELAPSFLLLGVR